VFVIEQRPVPRRRVHLSLQVNISLPKAYRIEVID
jgi:hypothetical protein